MKTIVISAHPDDEVLGCGGTLLKHKDNNDECCWLIVTDAFLEQGFSKEFIKLRKDQIDKVSKKINFNKVYSLGYKTTELTNNSINKLIPQISKIFNEFQPEVIYLINRSDIHTDHRIVFESVISCTKSFRFPFIKKVLMYECISETEFTPALSENIFLPNYFVDISEYLTDKLETMKIYESELGTHPFPRSLKNIEALATFRGAMAGVKYAEAFQLLKYIDK